LGSGPGRSLLINLHWREYVRLYILYIHMVGLAQTLQIMGTITLCVWIAWLFNNDDNDKGGRA